MVNSIVPGGMGRREMEGSCEVLEHVWRTRGLNVLVGTMRGELGRQKNRVLMVCTSGVHIPFLGIDVLASIHNRLMADVPERRQRRTEGSEGTSTNGLAEGQKGGSR